MNGMHNSSELARKISEKLHLDQADSLKFFKELAELPDGYVKNALEALLHIGNNRKETGSMTRYAACIKGTCVRNAQYSKWDNAMPMDDNAWVYADETPLFLEIVAAETKTRATQIAAIHAGVSESVIMLFPVE